MNSTFLSILILCTQLGVMGRVCVVSDAPLIPTVSAVDAMIPLDSPWQTEDERPFAEQQVQRPSCFTLLRLQSDESQRMVCELSVNTLATVLENRVLADGGACHQQASLWIAGTPPRCLKLQV